VGRTSKECDILITKCGVTSLGALLVECEAVNTLHFCFKTVANSLGNNVEWRPPKLTLPALVASSELAANVRDCDTARLRPPAYRTRSTLTYAGVPESSEQKCHRPRGRRQRTCAGPAVYQDLRVVKPSGATERKQSQIKVN
jgi:hypothetical protein